MEATDRPVFDAEIPGCPTKLTNVWGTLRFEGEMSGRHEFPLYIVRGLNVTHYYVTTTPNICADDFTAVYNQAILDIYSKEGCWIKQPLSHVPSTSPGAALGGVFGRKRTFPVDENFRAFLEIVNPVRLKSPVQLSFVAHRPEWGRQNPFAKGEQWVRPLPALDGGTSS